MLLDRYFSSHTYETLSTQELMVTRPGKMNDPFECLGTDNTDLNIERVRDFLKSRKDSLVFYEYARRYFPNDIHSKKDFRRLLKFRLNDFASALFDGVSEVAKNSLRDWPEIIDSQFRMCCFCSESNNPQDEILMWSHYAAKHAGIRIQFNLEYPATDFYIIRKVIYSDDRVDIDFLDDPFSPEFVQIIYQVMERKAKGWSYENEYRLIAPVQFCKHREIDSSSYSFIQFDSRIVARIDFGINCPGEEIERIKMLASQKYPHAILRKAQHHETKYAISYVEIQ